MSNLDHSATPIAQAQQIFTREQLPFPPLPEPLALQLQADSEFIFSTRALEYGPYNLELFRDEVLDGDTPEDYAILGFDGHGTNSWAVHYFLLQPGLALFLQCAWGGAYDEPEEDRQLINQIFPWARGMQGAAARAHTRALLPGRLVVVYSPFIQSGWGWVNQQSTPVWHDTPDVLNASASALLELLNPTPTSP